MRRIIAIVAVVVEIILILLFSSYGHLVAYNNTDSMYELITERYSTEELCELVHGKFLYGKYDEATELFLNFKVECARKVGKGSVYYILLDENDKAWMFYFFVDNAGNHQLYTFVEEAHFLSKDDIAPLLPETSVAELREMGVQVFWGPYGNTNYTAVYVKEGMYILYGDNNQFYESLFIPNEKLREKTIVDLRIPYILDIDRE